MSADNRICILRNEVGDWCLWMGSLSSDYHSPPLLAECYLSREKAMEKAKKLAEETVILEGGIEEISSKEQSIALARDLEDLSMRLRLLLVSGSQWERNFN